MILICVTTRKTQEGIKLLNFRRLSNIQNITLSVVSCEIFFSTKVSETTDYFYSFFAVHQYDWSPSVFKRVVRDKI